MRSILLKNPAKKVKSLIALAFSLATLSFANAQATFQSSLTATGDKTPAVVSKPANTEVGNLLVVGIMYEKGGTSQTTITPPAGQNWILVRRVDRGADFGTAIYYKIATATDAQTSTTNYSFGLQNDQKWSMGLTRISNVDLSPDASNNVNPIEVSATATTQTAPSITTLGDNRLVLCFFSDKSGRNFNAIAGTSEKYDQVGFGLVSNMMATFVQTTQGATPAYSATGSASFPISIQLAIKPGLNPLPVELISFNAAKKSGEVALTWETASEKNNTGFEVQASVDGKNYEAVGFVASQNGNASSAQRYGFIHKTANKEGLVYYRLKQIDMDGTFEYYTAKVVDLGRFATTVNTFPNPFQNRFELNLTATAAETADIQIMDMAGKIVYATKQTLSKGANTVSVELNKQPAGIYLLKTTTGKQVYTNNLVKQ